MLAGETSTTNWDIPGYALWGNVTAGPPNETPIYCYYTGKCYKINTLSIARITYDLENVNEVSGPCGGIYPLWGFGGGGLQAGSASSTVGRLGDEVVTFGELTHVADIRPTVTSYSVTALPSGSWVSSPLNPPPV